MTDKEYINLLEEAVTMHSSAPANPIVNWQGKGDLPTTMDADEIDYLVKKIVKGDGVTDKAIVSPNSKDSGVSVKEDTEDAGKAPLSILENELDKSTENLDENTNTDKDDINITEDLDFTDQESDILSRLITEMGEMEATFSQDNDDLLDTEEIDTLTPSEDYELDDLDNY